MLDQSESLAALPAPLPPATANDDLPFGETLGFTFTGSGKEYFRIWIVNLLLTVVTVGIYSAWAKVRRLQYFDRNTQLAGAVFDFRGDPKAILRGRVLAVVLLAAYQYAFGFSLAFGATIVAILLLALPFMMRSALRFRLHNTRYRGLHADFTGSIAGAYRVYLPWMLTVLLPSAPLTSQVTRPLTPVILLLFALWPLTHGAMKRYQHRHLQLGATASAYTLPARRFYRPYLMAGALALHLLFLYLASMIIYTMIAGAVSHKWISDSRLTLFSLLFACLAFLLIGPFIQVRVANLAWSNTTFPGVEMRSAMSARAFARLQTVNWLLTLMTLGLYRPFAVVNVYRFRLANVTLHTTTSFELLVSDALRSRRGATGDGVADLAGIDFSW